MMRSSMNANSSSFNDDDDFAPNPFRSSGGNASDLLDQTPRQQHQQQQQQQFHDPFQTPQMYAAQPPPPSQMYAQQSQQLPPPPQMMQQQPGAAYYPQQQHHHQQPPPPSPVQYMSGTMDTGGAARPEQARPPVGAFGWLLSCVRLDQVGKLFDVDADDVALRLRYSLTEFFRPDYFRTTVLGDTGGGTTTDTSSGAVVGAGKGPDLYGPFWVSMTLIFILGVASNLSDYLHYQRKSDPDSQFEYDITHVLHAMYIVFAFSFGVPTGLWLAASCMGLSGSVQWPMWVCCYGYSMAPILAATLVAWWLPFWIWNFTAMAAGVGASCLLVLRNLSTPLLTHEDNHAKAAPFLLCILGIHVTYLLVLMLTFFPGK